MTVAALTPAAGTNWPPPESTGVVMEAEGLSRRYADVLALDNLDLAIAKGEVFCLLGANGAGKTTTINLFLNFVEPTSGTVHIAGLDVTRHPLETRRHVAYIPEQVMLYRNLSGLENLDYFATLASGRRHHRDELMGYLSRSGLQLDAVTRRVSDYSKGMRQKVGIAIALAKRAKALLLDEPTAGLDPKAANEFSNLLEMMREDGAAILMATHDLFRAKQSGTRVGIMRNGQLVRTLSTSDIGHADLERLYLEHMNA